MIYSGTVIVSGKIEAIVISTGMNTELGKIASVLDTKEEPATPIQMKVAKVSRFITGVCLYLNRFCLNIWTNQSLYHFKYCYAMHINDCS